MHGRGSDDEDLVIWITEVIFVSRTQPSGPLCLWQCFICSFQTPIVRNRLKKKSEVSWQSLMEMIDWMFALLNSWFLRQPYSRRTFFPSKPETNFLDFIEEASRASPWAPHRFYAHFRLFLASILSNQVIACGRNTTLLAEFAICVLGIVPLLLFIEHKLRKWRGIRF